jgi:arylsulfatase A-like enzyme
VFVKECVAWMAANGVCVGGYPKFIEQGLNEKHLGVWLQDEGYNTYYTGKMMNGHSVDTYDRPRMRGWNGSDFLIDPGTYVSGLGCYV